MKYVVRLKKKDEYDGYYAESPSWSAVPLSRAKVFNDNKSARRMVNRLNSRLLKGPDGCGECFVEPYEPKVGVK